MPLPDLRIATAVVAAPLGRLAANFDRTAAWTARARSEGARVVCFPEMNLTGYSPRAIIKDVALPIDSPMIHQLERLSNDSKMVILAGFAETDQHGRIFASHLVAAPGRTAAVYRKTHVAPPEQAIFCAGQRIPVFEIDGWHFGIQLCYDAHFPELTTRMALNGADIIFFPHASPRGTPQGKLDSWRRHLPARAFDNGLFAVACNQTGSNGEGLQFPGLAVAFGPSGQMLARETSGQEGLLCVDLKRDELEAVRRHRMRYFLPNRRPGLYANAAKSRKSSD
jgi:N-carbamoylputrescine amidase